jgi:hypothetical protein
VKLALADAELGGHARDARPWLGEPPRGGDHQHIRLGAAPRDRVGKKLQPASGRHAGHGLLESRCVLAPDRRDRKLPVAQLGRRQTEDRTGSAGP